MNELKKILNVNIAGFDELITPNQIKQKVPVTEKAMQNVLVSRQVIENILDGRDDRLFFVVGPCSIHDPKAAFDYAEHLKELAKKVEDKFFLLMRVYFEKPRTTVGWKGLINDPHLDDSFHIEEGLKIARELLIKINELGLACATETLDPITPQYHAELITWTAIGARTSESQTHREISSGLSMPVGFKNNADGNIQVAINAMKSTNRSHHFLGINEDGKVCKFSTRGNPYAHIILRGGQSKTNYDSKSISLCLTELKKNKLRQKIVVDCSHGNSQKDPLLQEKVLKDITNQIFDGNKAITGCMIESNLKSGNQELTHAQSLKYGVSITDACMDWEMTERMILEAYKKL
ncbi:MAG: 3-deoxy-7-phosphoheptulonate synthase [bacterium]|nr:3-deoxy-7-phosphoheptulonate synthase [bacterium]MBU1917661.1 3-deoxy-7-phosphoheptulonate synthase [bacterium]